MKYKSDYKIYKLTSRPRIPTLPIKEREVKRRYDLFSNALINVNRAFFQAINLMFYLKQLLGALQPLFNAIFPHWKTPRQANSFTSLLQLVTTKFSLETYITPLYSIFFQS